MTINVRKDKLYPFSEIASMDLFPKRTSYRTIWRYATDGRVNTSGVTVFLDCVKTPSGLATSKSACQKFLEELNE